MAGVFLNEHYDDGEGEGYEGRMLAARAQEVMHNAVAIRNALNQSPLLNVGGPFVLQQQEDMVTWRSPRYDIMLGFDNGEYGLTIYGEDPNMVEPLTPEALAEIKNILSPPAPQPPAGAVAQAAGRRRRKTKKTKKHMKKRRTMRR